MVPGLPLPPLERPPRALLEASLAAEARAGVSAPMPAAIVNDADGCKTRTESATKTATTALVAQQPQQPPQPSCSSCLLAAAPGPGDEQGQEQEGEYPLTPVGDDARSALVDKILKACEPGDPVLASICRLLRSVLGVPMASVTLISHAQAWFKGGESVTSEGAGGGGGGSGGCSPAASGAEGEKNEAADKSSPASTSAATATTNELGPMPRGRVLCAYSLIGEPDVRELFLLSGWCVFFFFFFFFPLSFVALTFSSTPGKKKKKKTYQIVVIEDALTDPRTRFSPLVGAAGLRFYAGAPLIVSTGARLGSLCCTDLRPRKLSADHARVLANFAELVVRQLEKDYFDKYQLPAAAAAAAAPAAAPAPAAASEAEENGSASAPAPASPPAAAASACASASSSFPPSQPSATTFSSRLLRSVDTVRRASAIVDVGSPGWPILCANQRWAFLTGAGSSAGDAIGRPFFDLYEPSSSSPSSISNGSSPRRPATAAEVARELAAHEASGRTSREDFVLDVTIRTGGSSGGAGVAASASAAAPAAAVASPSSPPSLSRSPSPSFSPQPTLRVLLRPLLAPALDDDTPAIVVPAGREVAEEERDGGEEGGGDENGGGASVYRKGTAAAEEEEEARRCPTTSRFWLLPRRQRARANLPPRTLPPPAGAAEGRRRRAAAARDPEAPARAPPRRRSRPGPPRAPSSRRRRVRGPRSLRRCLPLALALLQILPRLMAKKMERERRSRGRGRKGGSSGGPRAASGAA